MARRRRTDSMVRSSNPIEIGNCRVLVEAKNFRSKLDQEGLQISFSKTAKIRISVMDNLNENGGSDDQRAVKSGEYYFLVANPKNCDETTKSLLKDVISLYMRELPAMNFSANTGKESMFLERCVTHGKYCTLLLISKKDEHQREVIAAVTYQILPADTQYAEIPLAAVTSIFQRKGVGRLLYLELKRRLSRVGIGSIFCWGDKESEGFWLKLGFSMIGVVDTKGRARRLPIKANVRKALCFPGGSTLMVAHLPNSHDSAEELPSLCLNTNLPEQNNELRLSGESHEPFTNWIAESCQEVEQVPIIQYHRMNKDSKLRKCVSQDIEDSFPCSVQGTKKRYWESSCTSLMSKKVKGSNSNEYQMDSLCPVWTSDRTIVNYQDLSPNLKHAMHENKEKCRAIFIANEDSSCHGMPSTAERYRIMLMDIADGNKKSYLTKVIGDLGGVVASNGTECTHIVTGKVRRTLNFCTGLCSGAWIVSSGWLKESFRNGRFADETPFILNDNEYNSKYKTHLKEAVLRAKANPNGLLQGFDICFSPHVQPPAKTLSSIVSSAGGNVIDGRTGVSKTIFIANEEDIEEALSAADKGMLTFSSEWLMSCVMRQEVDLGAPQFAESL